MVSYSRKRKAGKRSFKKRTFRKKLRPYRKPSYRQTPLAAKVKRNSATIKHVAEIVDKTTGTLTNRFLSYSVHGSEFGRKSWAVVEHNSIAQIQDSITNLEYYDETTPGTLRKVDGNEGDFQREFLFKSTSTKMELYNQGWVPVTVHLWKCFSKEDTDISPVGTVASGLQNQLQDWNTGVLLLENVQPKDSQLFRDLYSTEDYRVVTILPGQRKEFTHRDTPFSYDPSLWDSHRLNHQGIFKNMQWLITFSGDPVMDSTQSNLGVSASRQLLITEQYESVIVYDAGIAMDRFRYVQPATSANAFAYQPQPDRQRITGEGSVPIV